MARFTLGLLFVMRLLSPTGTTAHALSAVPADAPAAAEGAPTQSAGDTAGEGLGAVVATPGDVPAMISDAAHRWGLDANQLLRVAWCESKFDPGAYNRRSGASGVFQFIPVTWYRASAAVGLGHASPFDAHANVEAAAWLMKTEGPRHWTCR